MLSKSEWSTKNVIYCYTNKINGKRYVGQTSKTLKTRHNQHVKSSYNEKSNDYNVPFHSAIRKYGIDNFELEILHIVDEYSIDMTEIFYIEYFDTLAKNGKGAINGRNGGSYVCKKWELVSEEEYNEAKKQNIKCVDTIDVYNEREEMKKESNKWFENLFWGYFFISSRSL